MEIPHKWRTEWAIHSISFKLQLPIGHRSIVGLGETEQKETIKSTLPDDDATPQRHCRSIYKSAIVPPLLLSRRLQRSI